MSLLSQAYNNYYLISDQDTMCVEKHENFLIQKIREINSLVTFLVIRHFHEIFVKKVRE